MTLRLIPLLLAAGTILFSACDEVQDTPPAPIQVGAANADSIRVPPQATRMLLLSGGTGKYAAYVSDSKVASVALNKDTLRVTGILEGTTYAVIHSGDLRRRIALNVAPPPVSVSQTDIRLYPRDESKFVSVNGGGELADLEVEDPDRAIRAKWNAKSGILEIEAFYEGDATVRIIPRQGPAQTVRVAVRCEGRAERPGIYGTTSRSLFKQMNTLMAVRRKGVGVWLCNSTRPDAALRSLKITPVVVDPQRGERLTLNYAMRYPDEFRNSSLTEGPQSLYVEEVREKVVVLRGRGHKLVVPYEKR